MSESKIYEQLSQRTGGACMLGVVGPVRTGKSSFIQRFMEKLVIPRIENSYMRQRAWDELPQSGSGRSIMTAEPKFVPEEPVSIALGENSALSVRLVDCVGYMVEGAAGQMEDGRERMVTTPWFDHEVTMSQAAEQGTELVIRQHADIGIVVTCDGSICELPREAYREPEGRVTRELQEIGKPFVVILNSSDPEGEEAQRAAEEIRQEYGVGCLPVNCLSLEEAQIVELLRLALEAFPLRSLGFYLPPWVNALPDGEGPRAAIFEAVRAAGEGIETLGQLSQVLERLRESELFSAVETASEDLGRGAALIRLELPRAMYYEQLSRLSGREIPDDRALLTALRELSEAGRAYARVREALEDVEKTGYGVVLPDTDQMRLEQPQIVQQGGKYSVKLRAGAPVIHMLRTEVDCEVNPAIGGDSASDDILGFLLQGFDGDVNRIWESKIFGRSLNELAEESLHTRIASLPENAKLRLRETLQRLVNEDSSGLICILL